MSAIDDGGPAFPLGVSYLDAQARDFATGLTARDYFAKAAMHAQLSACLTSDAASVSVYLAAKETGRTLDDQIAANSYIYADAMLRARANKL